ncbi:hypothetical protein [Flammeovirga agarivorans]|uniref:Transcription elongation factor n=1 Tax=Flammeovirga agarivorans TaxID=2726742 RepID=A0A7X8XVT0_9BACT|nr:hypothetical protein [Flammeovirga agarivorans]NLR91638.1 hypothetical protein [Flammeovirga agarivorans]
MLKKIIRNCIEEYQKNKIDTLKEELQNEIEASKVNDTDLDSQSHRYQALTAEVDTSARVVEAIAAMNHLKKIPVHKSKSITEGSLIEIENMILFVGINTQKFHDLGHDIMGISVSSPLFKTLENKSAGDMVRFNDQRFHVLSVK